VALSELAFPALYVLPGTLLPRTFLVYVIAAGAQGFGHGVGHSTHIVGHAQFIFTFGSCAHGVAQVVDGAAHGFAHGVTHGFAQGFAQVEHGVDSPANADAEKTAATATAITISAAFLILLLLVSGLLSAKTSVGQV
jgi:hypothetical protein